MKSGLKDVIAHQLTKNLPNVLMIGQGVIMTKVAVVLRFLQFYSQISHNYVSGATFFQDHAFLGELYGAYTGAYDSVVERMIGLDQKPDLFAIHRQASEMLTSRTFVNVRQCLEVILSSEKALLSLIEKEVLPNPMTHPHGGEKSLSQGSVQLLGDIANESEVRQYKIKQRLA